MDPVFLMGGVWGVIPSSELGSELPDLAVFPRIGDSDLINSELDKFKFVKLLELDKFNLSSVILMSSKLGEIKISSNDLIASDIVYTTAPGDVSSFAKSLGLRKPRYFATPVVSRFKPRVHHEVSGAMRRIIDDDIHATQIFGARKVVS